MIGFLLWLLPYIAPAIIFADNFYWPWQAKGWTALAAWPLLVAYTVLVWIADMALAHTVWAYHFGMPHIGEVTISHTLERLYPTRQPDAVRLALAINSHSPGHIKAALK